MNRNFWYVLNEIPSPKYCTPMPKERWCVVFWVGIPALAFRPWRHSVM